MTIVLDLRPVNGMATADRQAILEINEILARGANSLGKALLEAGKKFCELSDKTRERIKNHPDKERGRFAEALERVGQKALHPQLALASGFAARHLGRLSYEEQETFVQNLISVALPDGDTINMRPEDLSREQCAQVFDVDRKARRPPRVRPLPEQKAWLETIEQLRKQGRKRERDRALVVKAGRYRLENGRFFPLPAKAERGFTVIELERIVGELKRLK